MHKKWIWAALPIALWAGPAFAHHVMAGRLPLTFAQGLLSGLAHPIIGLDHFAAVIAVGCLAAAHRAGPALAAGYVLAMIAGVAGHMRGAGVPGAEILVALTVVILGMTMLRRQSPSPAAALTLFALTGVVHGYALGESIYGAEASPLTAYLIGLAAIQTAIALGAMALVRVLAKRWDENLSPLRLAGAGIAGIGVALLAQQIASGA